MSTLIIRTSNAVADGFVPVAVSVFVLAAVFVALIAGTLTGVGLIEW